MMDFDLGRDVSCIWMRPLWWDWDIKAGRCEFGHQSGSIFELVRMDMVMSSCPNFSLADCIM
jgi:hypothetical protein